MRFLWDEQNRTHLARHAVDPDIAESIFIAEDRLLFAVDGDPGRFIAEGTVEGKTYRLVFALAGPDLVYPITAFRIARMRRRKS